MVSPDRGHAGLRRLPLVPRGTPDGPPTWSGATSTTRLLAGPFTQDSRGHWLTQSEAIAAQFAVAAQGSRVTTAFVASGALTARGRTDVYVTETHQ